MEIVYFCSEMLSHNQQFNGCLGYVIFLYIQNKTNFDTFDKITVWIGEERVYFGTDWYLVGRHKFNDANVFFIFCFFIQNKTISDTLIEFHIWKEKKGFILESSN